MKLKFKSITNLIAKFTPLALFAAMGLALAAPQTAQGGNYYKFVILGVKANPSSGSVNTQFAISELALYSDAAGSSRLNGSGTITGVKNVESGLGEGECFATAYDKGNGSPLNAFDGNINNKWWGTAGDVAANCPYIVMRLADSAAPAMSYNLATADVDYRNVTKWVLYYKTSEEASWEEIARQSLEDKDLPSQKAWYNNSVPFPIGTQPPSSDKCWVRFTITKKYPATSTSDNQGLALSRFALYDRDGGLLNASLGKVTSSSKDLEEEEFRFDTGSWEKDTETTSANVFLADKSKMYFTKLETAAQGLENGDPNYYVTFTMRLKDGAVPTKYNLAVADVTATVGKTDLLGRYPIRWTVWTSKTGEDGSWTEVSTVSVASPPTTANTWYIGGSQWESNKERTPIDFYSFNSTPSKKSIADATVTYVPTSATYDGEKHKPTVTVMLGGDNITDQCDFTWTPNENFTDAATYTPTITAKSTSTTYEGTVLNPGSFEITAPVKKSIANATVTYVPTSATYDGSQQKPTVTVTLGGDDITDQCDFTWTPNEGFTDAATYTPTIEAKDGTDYEGKVTNPGSFTINKANISASATGVTTTYDNTAKKITVTVTSPSSDTTTTYSTSQSGTYSETHPECKNVGTYTIYWKVSKDSNYNDATGSATITINKKTLTVHATINGTAGDTTINVGAQEPTYGVSYSGFAYGDDASKLTTQPTSTCNPVYSPSSPEGSVFTVTPAGGDSGNYDFNYVSHTFRVVSTSGGQWFRLIIKDVKGPTKSHIQLDELALYDASFNRVNADLVESSSPTGLDFGRCAYSGSGDVVTDAPVGNLFDGNLDRNHMWAREGVSFTEGNYPTITMHLPSDAAPVVYYNFASGGETANRSGCCAPVSWRLERSTDGVNWELFHEQTNADPVVENDTWLVKGGTENPPQYVIRGDGKVAEWMKPPRQFIRLTILKTSNGGTGVKTVGRMKIGKIALFDAQGNSIIPTDADDKNKKIGTITTLQMLKRFYEKPGLTDNQSGQGQENLPRLNADNTEWHIEKNDITLSDCHWYIVTTNDSPLAAYDLRTSVTASVTEGNKECAVLAWRIDTSATGDDDDWQFFDERDFSMYAAVEDSIPFTGWTWYGKGSGGDPDPGKAFRPSFLNQVASSPLRIYDSDPDPLAKGGDIILKDGGDYIHVFINASVSATFTVYQGSILEVLAVGAGGAGSVGGGNAGDLAVVSNLSVSADSSYTIQVGAGSSGDGGASTVTKVSGVPLSLTANGGTAGGSDGKGGNGAWEDGLPASGNVGGKGGAGILKDILGWDVYFAGGGGGAGSAGWGAGGKGGGGSKASSDYSSINGEPGLGGGGGGLTSGTAGVGGSGLVVIRVKDATGLSSVTLDKTLVTYGDEGWDVFPTETVKDGSGRQLTRGSDYTTKWTKNLDGSEVSAPDSSGVYTLTVTGSDSHRGVLTAEYMVSTRYITIAHNYVETLYTGSKQKFPEELALANTNDLNFLVIKMTSEATNTGKYTHRYEIDPEYRDHTRVGGKVEWWDGSTNTAQKDVTWEIKSEEFDIPLDKNGGSVDPDPLSVHVRTGETLPSLQPTQINLNRTGYVFAGYGDMWDGSGTTYYNADGISSMKYPAKGGAARLFALWTARDYPVELRDDTTVLTNVNAHLNEYMPDVEVPKKTGWTFEGYFKNQDGTGDQYYNELGNGILKYTDESVTTLYAKWKANFVEVTLHGNGGTPDSQSVTAYPGQEMPGLPQIPTRTGYVFEGYFDAETGGTKYYNADGSSAKDYPAEAGPADLYAHWVSRGLIIVVH